MKSLFIPVNNSEIIERINRLSSNTKPEWGKMTVAQMVTHAQKPFLVAFDELKLKRGLIGVLFGGIAKKKLISPEPFGRNLPTDPNFKISGSPEFEKEKSKLMDYVKLFSQKGPAGLTKDPHPFFGKLSPDEWDTLMYKHLDHHLRQFGV
jgi:hypothetical protein